MLSTDSPRFLKIADHLTARTRLQKSQIVLVSEIRTDFSVTVECRQLVTLQTKQSEGAGRSQATLLSGVDLIPAAAKAEVQRLEAVLPARVDKWLAGAPASVGHMPAVKVFDFDAQSFGHDHECAHCAASGQLPCVACGCSGRCDCKGCYGAKSAECPRCEGACEHTCLQCHGATSTECTHCHGRGLVTCNNCYGAGEKSCYSCGGAGYSTRTETVVRDIGKGPYSTTESIRSNCMACSGSGKLACSVCYRRKEVDCGHCNHGRLRCLACDAGGKQRCSLCSESGRIVCSTCRGVGDLVCASCHGKKSVDCPQCRASGWLHTQERVFAKLAEKSAIDFSADLPGVLLSRVRALFASPANASEGNFQLANQSRTDGMATGLLRRWVGTFPVWEMCLKVGDLEFKVHAVGNSQLVDDLSAMTQAVLAADRTDLQEALKSGAAARSIAALKTYLLSADHQVELLAHQKNPGASARDDVQGALAFLVKAQRSVLSRWKWLTVALLLLGLVPLLLGLRFRFDLVFLLVFPGFVLLAAGALAGLRARQCVRKATGNPAFSQAFNAVAVGQWRSGGVFGKGLFLGLAFLAAGMVTSPAKPFAVQKLITQAKLKLQQSSSQEVSIQASKDLIQQWMTCGGANDDVYTALKSLEQAGVLTYFRTEEQYERIFGMRWNTNSLSLFDRPVYEIAFFPVLRRLDNLGSSMSVSVELKADALDPATLIKRLDVAAVRVPSQFMAEAQRKPNEGKFLLKGVDTVWQTSLSEFRGYKAFSNYVKPPRQLLTNEKEFFKVKSLKVSCNRDVGDFWRTR